MNLKLRQVLGLSLLTVAGLADASCSSSSGSSCSSTALPVDLSGVSCETAAVSEVGYGKTFFSLRPQHSDGARDQMGTSGRIHQFAKQEFHGDVSLALQWQQSTNDTELGSWFFFNGTNSMTYGPNWNAAANTEEVDVNSLNFAVTASGTIVATPRVQNLVADFQLYLGWDEFVQGLWTRVGVPVNYVRTDMRLADTVGTADANNFLAGYYNIGDFDDTSSLAPVYDNLAEAWVGDQAAGDLPVRANGNINGRRSHVSVAGLSFELGYDFLRREHGHLGLSLRAVAPTGNTPSSTYVFEPISGANSCWEIGGGLTGAYELWSDSDDSSLNFAIDANVTHVGRRAQRRLLNLKNIRSGSDNGSTSASAGSSWLVLKKFSSSDVYAGTLAHAADKLALVVKVGNAVMADAAASLKYRWGNYGLAVGYNFWARSKETASAREASVFDTDNYAIKEASGNHGSSSNMNTSNTVCATKASSDITRAGTTVTSSPSAQYLTDADVDVCAALHPSVRSHKVFGSVEYNWSDNEWEPYLLLGGSYEIGCKASDVKNSAVNQWGVLAKGGIAF